jgi:tryptophan-rich sensory protein
MDQAAHKHPAHVAFATIAITLMAVSLAVGLEFLRILDRLDAWITTVVIKPGFSAPVNSLDPYLLWTATTILAFGLTAVMLNVSGSWRRVFVWVLALIINAFWIPVLLLASHKPEIGVAMVGLLWAGCCSLVYTMNHEMPADLTENNNTPQTDATR